MNYEFRRVTEENVKELLTWKYDGIYSFFDNDFSQGKIDYIKTFPQDENAFSIFNDNNELVGSCTIYLNEQVTFSVQMKPALTSKGLGKGFMEAFLKFAKEKYQLKTIGLTVLKFNERAIRLYKSLGFKETKEFIGKTVKGDMEFLAMEKEI